MLFKEMAESPMVTMDIIITLLNNELFQIALIGTSLAFAQLCEQYQIPLKLFSARKDKVATGYNNAMKSMVINRCFIIIYLFSISFSIENGASSSIIFKSAITAFIIWTILSFMLFKYTITKLKLKVGECKWATNRYGWLALIAVTFNLIGLTLPHLGASIFIDYRMTIANFGFIFNTCFTLISVFFIEKVLSSYFDRGTVDDSAIISILYLRTFAGLLAMAIYMLGYMNLIDVEFDKYL